MTAGGVGTVSGAEDDGFSVRSRPKRPRAMRFQARRSGVARHARISERRDNGRISVVWWPGTGNGVAA